MKYYLFSVCMVILLILGCKPQTVMQEKEGFLKEEVGLMNEVLVQLTDVKYAKELAEDFKEYGLVLHKQLIPAQPMFLYHFDASRIKGQKLLERLRTSNKVKECQLNHKVSPR